jgi:glycerol 3-phosphatase-1
MDDDPLTPWLYTTRQKQIGTVSQQSICNGLLIDSSLLDVKFIEGRIPIEYGQSAVLIPGGNAILQSLEEADAPWAIVTSGTRALAIGWLDVLKLAHPEHLVVAEDVPNGKPDPACYLLGRQNLGLALEDPVLVIEDAPAGIKAGKAAGCKVLSLTTTHSAAQVRAAGADWILRDLRDLQLKSWDKGSRRLTVEIANALQD